jgi:hypothetical protein
VKETSMMAETDSEKSIKVKAFLYIVTWRKRKRWHRVDYTQRRNGILMEDRGTPGGFLLRRRIWWGKQDWKSESLEGR